jgi:diguanylate cyclase (GGDEF)-like protein
VLTERPTVLLVDDDCDMDMLVRAALEPWCRVQVVRTLKGAQRATTHDDFDCLLLDLSLPDGDGCQVLEALRRHRDNAFVPCIVLTASAEQYRISEALALGADGFLIKPVSNGRLAANVGRALQRRESQSRAVYRDSLTEILNRRGFEEAAERAISFALRTDTPLSLAILDLDGFKAVNDRLGHFAGDRVLRRFAHVLRRYLRREDVPGRWGGDEFVVLFPNSPERGALRALEKVRQVLEEAPLDPGDPRVRFSAGVASLRAATRTVHDLLRVADKRMYANKATRRAERFDIPKRAPT